MWCNVLQIYRSKVTFGGVAQRSEQAAHNLLLIGGQQSKNACSVGGCKRRCQFGRLGVHHLAGPALRVFMRLLVVGCRCGRRHLRLLAFSMARSSRQTMVGLVSIDSAAITTPRPEQEPCGPCPGVSGNACQTQKLVRPDPLKQSRCA
jgi:hypothetical protein